MLYCAAGTPFRCASGTVNKETEDWFLRICTNCISLLTLSLLILHATKQTIASRVQRANASFARLRTNLIQLRFVLKTARVAINAQAANSGKSQTPVRSRTGVRFCVQTAQPPM